jgi:TonB family protein
MRRETGEVQLYVVVTEEGAPEKVEVRISSGLPVLDRSSRQHVKNFWRWPAGAKREYLVPIEFVIR